MKRLVPFLCLAIATIACSNESDQDSKPPPDGPLPGPTEWNRDVTPPSDAEAATKRGACGYAVGALPAETQGKSHPNGKDIPIDHVLVMMMENRSFDHYFQKLPEYGQPDVEVAPAGFTNPDADGNPVPPFHDTQYCFVDTNHEWSGSHQQYGGGKMDGFFLTNDGFSEAPPNGSPDLVSGKRALAYYDETDLPFYYWLAGEFAIADHYHCSLLGPTFPNRMYLYAATSFGVADGSLANTNGQNILIDNLELRQIDWKVYGDGIVGEAEFPDKFIPHVDRRHFLADLYADAAAGTLPQFAFVDPNLGMEAYNQNDEHPPAMAQGGQKLVAQVVDAIAESPAWSRTALFITYDEHGGLWDHVPPPAACPPDDRKPNVDPKAAFDRLGIRVPMMVVSPWAKKHFVSHHTYDHTSIVRFVEARFVMPAMTARDANAEAPWEMFDFSAPPHATPPAVEIPDIPADKLAACKAIFD